MYHLVSSRLSWTPSLLTFLFGHVCFENRVSLCSKCIQSIESMTPDQPPQCWIRCVLGQPQSGFTILTRHCSYQWGEKGGRSCRGLLGCDPEQAPKLLLLRVLPHQGQHLIQKAPAGNERSSLQDLKKSPKQIQELTFKYRAVCTACTLLSPVMTTIHAQ